MKLNERTRAIIIETVCLLYILLFVYATVSKLLDFQNFQIQIGQSPLLSAFATEVSIGVPVIEFILVLLLLLPKYRLYGLYGSFSLMTMFSAYIYIILNFSSFTPCSCGGILEQMSWNQHLVFNLVFVLISAIAVILLSLTKFVYGFLTIHFISGISIVSILFLMSEDIIQHRNNFVRRLPEQFEKIDDMDLKFNSYYFAGSANGKIYLGNVTSPLLLTEIDEKLKTKKEIIIKISNTQLPFRSLQIQVQSKYFFISDGTVPCIFRGKTGNWSASAIEVKDNYFVNPVFIDSLSIAYRTRKANGESTLATAHFGNDVKSSVNTSLLQKQIDGIFDVDGSLMFDPFTNKVVYLYYYRNQFIVANPQLNLNLRGKTIDTISRAQIKVAFNTDRNEKKLAAPPLTVNKKGVTYKGLLFVNSALMGKFEDAKMWKQASMIDVYDTANSSYIVSFYVYNIEDKRLNSFMVNNDYLYALIGTHLVSYKLNKMITNRYSR